MKGTYYWIPAQVKLNVAKRDKGICQVCGLKAKTAEISKRGLLIFKTKNGQTFHYDHIIRVSSGGGHTIENLRLACPSCNLSKLKSRAHNDRGIQDLLSEFFFLKHNHEQKTST
jgi:5-methylcytosine-specific restriction endonuclease McrA